jgi:hypothetical protein
MDEPHMTGEAWIQREQLNWARNARLEVDGAGYCLGPELKLPWLTERIRADLLEGAGNEFGKPGGRGIRTVRCCGR